MEKKLKFNQPKKLPLPDDYVSSIKFSPVTDESYIGKNSGISAGTTLSHKLDISGQSLIKKDGYIRIGMDRKVYFEYYGLPKPKKEDFFEYEWYLDDLEEYEASKQLIKVINAKRHGYLYLISAKEGKHVGMAEDNQPCKAEVTNNKATIVELTEKTNTN